MKKNLPYALAIVAVASFTFASTASAGNLIAYDHSNYVGVLVNSP
ncbi:hypothetical protein [Neomicrococcus lactis]|nr:hypothetical protein [Neomicrococcus lactis]